MKFTSALLLPLAGLASAVDIYFHHDYNCGSAYEVYTGANPGQCIWASSGASAVAFMGIPQDWNLLLETYRGDRCSATGLVDKSDDSKGRNYICLGADDKHVLSAVYSFNGKKVRRGDRAQDREDCGKPEEWVTKDKVHFRTAELTREQIKELIDLTSDGAEGVELPELYQSLRQ